MIVAGHQKGVDIETVRATTASVLAGTLLLKRSYQRALTDLAHPDDLGTTYPRKPRPENSEHREHLPWGVDS